MKYFLPTLLLCILLLTSSAQVNASALDYWAVDGSQKIKKNHTNEDPFLDINNIPLKDSSSNITWQGGGVKVFGARNEYVTFQIIAENNSDDSVDNVSLTLDKLNGPGGFVITNSSNSNAYNLIGKNIFAYKAAYLNITSPSRHVRNQLSYWIGEVPDPLIPNNTAASTTPSFSVLPKNNQALYFEIYIPKDVPTGVYNGTIIAKLGSSTDTQIPVELEVFDLTLNDDMPITNMFYINFGQVASRLGVQDTNDIRKKYLFEAKRHYMDLTANFTYSTFGNNFQNYVNGSNYTAVNGYYGPGEGKPHTMYSIGTYDLYHTPNGNSGKSSGFYPETSAAFKSAAEEWVKIFENDPKLSSTQYFKYMPDEPEYSGSTARVATLASWVHLGNYNGKSLKTFCTSGFAVSLEACDIWSLADPWSNNRAIDSVKINARKQAGDGVGIYNGINPWFGDGLHMLDSPATSSRVLPWTMAKFPQLDHYYLWQTVNGYTDDFNLNGGRPFRSFSGNTSTHDNADARVFYNGLDPFYLEDDLGLPGPIGSIRAKNWRAGVQDYKYLQLVKQKEGEVYYNDMVVKTVPKALYEVPIHSITFPQNIQHSWSYYGYEFEKNKLEMGRKLSGSVVPPPTNTPTPTISLTPDYNPDMDVNKDGKANIIDVIDLIKFIFK